MDPSIAFVDSSRMAEAAGLGLPSFRVALTRSKKRRIAETPLPTDIPEPDRYIGRSPIWSTDKMNSWVDARQTERARLAERKNNGVEAH